MINPLQAFSVRRQAQLSQLQMQSLTQLYQPIMGGRALSLYVTFMSLPLQDTLWSKPLLHSQLLEILNMGIQALDEARIRLEGIGLLRTYQDIQSTLNVSNQSLVYDMQLPFDAYEFFAHPNLSTALYQAIGDQEYALKVKLWQVERLQAQRYREITHSFAAVYSYLTVNDDLSRLPEETSAFLRHQGPNNNFDNSQTDFDYGTFLTYITSEEIDHSQLTQLLKDYVISSHQIYGLNEADMREVVLLARHPVTKRIQLERIKEIAQDLARKIADPEASKQDRQSSLAGSPEEGTPSSLHQPMSSDQDGRTLTASNQASGGDESVNTFQFTVQEKQLIMVCQQTSNINFLRNLKEIKGGFVTNSESYYLEDLAKKSRLSSEVINVLIYYILMVEKRSDVQRNELERLANQWQEQKITHAPMALNYIKTLGQEKPWVKKASGGKTARPSRRKGHYEEILPQWAKDSAKQGEKAPASSIGKFEKGMDNQADLKAKLRDLFGKERES